MDIMVSNLVRSKGIGNNITGEIFFLVNESYFPEQYWTDFPIVIFGWWINSYIAMIKNQEEKFEFLFMDGPYALEGTVVDKENYHIRYLNKITNEVVESETMNVASFEKILLSTNRKILRLIELENISNECGNSIKKAYGELKKFIQSKK